jgi:hypothetical protein
MSVDEPQKTWTQTYVVLPAHLLEGNGRALCNDQADGVVDDLNNGVGLGAELGGENLWPGSLSASTSRTP